MNAYEWKLIKDDTTDMPKWLEKGPGGLTSTQRPKATEEC